MTTEYTETQYKGRQNETKVPAGALEGKIQSVALTAEKMLEGIRAAGNLFRKDVDERTGTYLPSGGYLSSPNRELQSGTS